MLSVDNISLSFGARELFGNISFLVNERDRIGLTGKNGAGKSSLLKIIHGQLNPTGGAVSAPKELTTGYLPQQMTIMDSTTVLEETLSSFSKIRRTEKAINDITKQIEKRDDYTSPSYLNLCNTLTELQHSYTINGGDKYIAETEQALTGLGFRRNEFEMQTSKLSGGWRMRIELAKILLSEPGVLLLDEPTNHLDILSIRWLESYLKNFKGAVIVVSHDRAFLDNVTNRTLEISMGRIYDYNVAYSDYLVQRMERRKHQEAAFRNQQKMIDDNEKFIERFRYKNTKAVQVQSRIKKLEKLDRIEIDEEDNSAINIKFAPAPRAGSIVIEAENLSKSYDSNHVLENIDFLLERNEKVAFVGRNGEGKTTMAKIINGDTEYSGNIKKGHNLNIGYFAQNQDELLDESLTVFETIDNVARGDIRNRLRDLLGAFLFGGDEIDKKVKVLSGGERSRLALVKLLLEPYNLLILDEPTNHLDMRSKDILKHALLEYDGTLIVVSHDRDFLNQLTGKIYEFRAKKIREYNGGIYDFLKKRKIENLRSIEKKDNEPNITVTGGTTGNKMQYLQKKED
ncbi:MAG TPA: ABC-F family ATP-binding cassette domain-containing protein, partial [Bacteroidales bacterium]|nr:ABC-F family ATP-binding cassette domain-containing protein [Bacteroidales bacterium]